VIRYEKKAVLNEIMCTDTKKGVLNENRSKVVEKMVFLTKSSVQIRKKAVLNENRSKDVEKAVPKEMAPP